MGRRSGCGRRRVSEWKAQRRLWGWAEKVGGYLGWAHALYVNAAARQATDEEWRKIIEEGIKLKPKIEEARKRREEWRRRREAWRRIKERLIEEELKRQATQNKP